METIRIANETTLYIERCYLCATLFAMDTYLQQERKSDGRSFFCPNGHGQIYTKSLAAELEEAKRSAEQLRADLDQAAAARRKLESDLLDKAKELGQMKRHVKAGLCPYCRRHFVNLERHVQGKHSEGEKHGRV